MAIELVKANLSASDNLSEKLDDVATSATKAGKSLERAEDAMEGMATSAAAVKKSLSSVSNEFIETTGTAEGMGQATDSLRTDVAQLTAILQRSQNSVSELSQEQLKAIVAATGFSGSAKELSASLQATRASVNAAEEETDEYRNSMLEASGAAQLLQLESSALSINVGAFTVALRNATTQIPMLVAVLGNLSAAFAGVAGASAAAAGGIMGVIGGGLLAQVEELTGGFGDLEDTMAAFQAVGQEVASLLLKAVKPLREMEGAAEGFKNIIEGLAGTVNAFAKSIRRSFEAGEQLYGLKDFMNEIGSAWMSNLDEITAGFQTMFRNIGPIVSDMIVYVIENFNKFANFVSQVTLEVAALFSSLEGSVGDFIVEMMNLGRAVGAGLVPVVGTFLNIMTGLATVINNADQEFVGMVAHVAGLLIILNKFSGTIASVTGLVGGFGHALADVTSNANSVGDAFARMGSRITNVLSESNSGFVRLGSVVKELIPTADEAFGTKFTTLLSDGQKQVSSLGNTVSSFTKDLVDMGAKYAGITETISVPTRSGIRFPQETDETLEGLEAISYKLGSVKSSIIGTFSNTKQYVSGGVSDLLTYNSTLTGTKRQVLGFAAAESYRGSVMNAAKEAVSQVSTELAKFGKWLKSTTVGSYLAAAGQRVYNAAAWAGTLATNALTGAVSLLNVALGTLALTAGAAAAAIGAIVVLGGTVTAVLATMGGKGSKLMGIFNKLRDGIIQIGSAALPIFVGSANMLIDILKGIMAPLAAIKNGLAQIGAALGIVSEGASSFDIIAGSVDALKAVLNPIMNLLGNIARIVGGMIAKSFQLLAGYITWTINLWKDLINAALGFIGLDLGAIMDGISDAIDGVMAGIDMLVEGFMWVFESVGELWNRAASAVNSFSLDIPDWAGGGSFDPSMPTINFGSEIPSKSNVTASDAKEGAKTAGNMLGRDAKETKPESTPSNFEYNEGDVRNNYNQNIDAQPDEKDTMKRAVEDAIEEANSFRRQQEGHSG